MIRVYSGYVDGGSQIDTSTFQLLIQWDVNLYGLTFLKEKIETADNLQFPRNSIVIKLRDGFYWVPPSLKEPKGLDLETARKLPLLRVDRSRLRRSYSKSLLMRINHLQQGINQSENNTCVVAQQTEAFLRQAVTSNQALKAHVEKLRLLVAKRRQDECAQRRSQKAEATGLESARAT